VTTKALRSPTAGSEVELIIGRSAKIGVTEHGLRRCCSKKMTLGKLHETRIEPRALLNLITLTHHSGAKVLQTGVVVFEFILLVMWPAPP
jgi:hypothetical protein